MKDSVTTESGSVIITGAGGFVASHLTDNLLAKGYEVIGVDNFCTGSPDNIAHLANHPGFTFFEHNVIAPIPHDWLSGKSVKWILHMASPASPPKYLRMPTDTLRVNSEGTYNLLNLARDFGSSFLFASTSECYGDPLEHPQKESYNGNVSPIGPRSVYDEAKRFGEAITSSYQRSENVDTRIIRIFNTYGPRMDIDDGRVVTNFLKQSMHGDALTIYGDGSQTRSFQYVTDLVAGITALMGADYHQPVNLGNPIEFTMLQLAEVVAETVGKQTGICFEALPEDDPKRRKPDISLAKSLLGWEPTVPLVEGIQLTHAYFESRSYK